jgi:hypothetical protein
MLWQAVSFTLRENQGFDAKELEGMWCIGCVAPHSDQLVTFDLQARRCRGAESDVLQNGLTSNKKSD